MDTIIDSIIEILKQISTNEQFLFNEIRFLKIQIIIIIFIILLLTLYSVYFIINNSKRINKIEKRLN